MAKTETKDKEVVLLETDVHKTHVFRGCNVIIGSNLAYLYRMETRGLNQAVITHGEIH